MVATNHDNRDTGASASPSRDALLAALKSVAAENNLQRIDIGWAPYGYSNGEAIVSIWFDAPDGVIGHTSAFGPDFDTAIDTCIAAKARKLATAPVLEAA